MNLYTPSQDTIDFVRKELNLNDRKIKEAVDHLKQWLKMQPHLPNEEEDCRLERWLINCKNNLENTKKAVDMYYSLKALSPEIMSDRDSNKPWFQNIKKHGYMITMPQLSPDGDRIMVLGLTGEDISTFSVEDTFRALLMYLDVRLIEDYYLKNVVVCDLKKVSLSHIKKVSPSILKKYILCVLKGHKIRIRSIHIINSSEYVNITVTMLKPFVSKKIISRIRFYGSDYTELYKYVPRHLLPTEMGGVSGSYEELFDLCVQSIVSYQDWFLAHEEVKADESKRPKGQVSCDEMFGIEGSFRRLEID